MPDADRLIEATQEQPEASAPPEVTGLAYAEEDLERPEDYLGDRNTTLA